MAVLKIVLTPQPAGARARSGVPAITSESTSKSQFWFESAFVQITRIFDITRTFGVEAFGQLANILVALLTPAALVAFVLGIWRVCADLGWAGAFFIADGFFSHWQVWIALSIGLKIGSSTLIAWGSRTGKYSEEN